MTKKWFQQKELSAGQNRLIITWYLYKFFGELPVRVIVFLVTLITFFAATSQRKSSKKYFRILKEYTNKNYLFGSLRQFLNYGNSLADKMIAFSGNIKDEKFEFVDNNMLNFLESNQGACFLTTHIGNIEILRSILQSDKFPKPPKVNILMEKSTCEIFNKFLDTIELDLDLETFSTEEIGIDTSVNLSEKLNNGEIFFMAGDRISLSNPSKVYKSKLLGRDIELPIGALKFAQLLDVPIFFIICVREGKKFIIHSERFSPKQNNKKETLEQLKKEYVDFLQTYTIKYPYQFFHFYDFFVL